MKRIRLSKFLIPKPRRLPGWSASFPSFSVSGSGGRLGPSVGPEELVGGVDWLVWDIRVDFGFLFSSCLGVLVRGQVETNSKRVSERIPLASGFHSRLTAVLAKDRLHEAHSGPATVCQLCASFVPAEIRKPGNLYGAIS